MFLRLYPVISVFIVLINLHKDAVILCTAALNGKYTDEIENFDLIVPHKLTIDGDFHSFNLPHFVDHDFHRTRKIRDVGDALHYGLHLDGKLHHVELWPNHDYLSPHLVIERRDPNLKVQDKTFRKLEDTRMCHYTGRVRNVRNSKVALSACDGLAGYIKIDNKRYFIEPVAHHQANDKGQHLHVVYNNDPYTGKRESQPVRCGTSENWEDVWKRRLMDKMTQGENAHDHKRGLKSEHRYLETLVVCDKKFIEHHKHTDMETYVMTIMNMVADFYHDSSSGNQMDVIVVRVIYLDKEEEEIDLVINPDADKTLASFCKWQMTVNPKDFENPIHHDIAVLLTRYDICSDNLSNCGLMGLAYVASACTSNEPCAINEDAGLNLGVVVAHEMGHVMGCAHDKEGESSCAAQDKDESYFVMAPYVNLFTTKWSTCSRGFMTALFENGLGDCLNDEPTSTTYPYKDLLPGVVYDAAAQCKMSFPNSMDLCMQDKESFCDMLICKTSPTECQSKEDPVADGTKCGENSWCYRKQCVPMGERPEAINGGWGEWGAWSSCSRTCGIGTMSAERDCNNPVPQNKGRYCLGERRKVKTCNVQPCPDGSPSFRAVQCTETDSKPFKDKLWTWKPYIKEAEPCVLYCLNNNNVFMKRKDRVKDGTSCKAGTKNVCTGGKVGCDNQLDSDAVEDVCGVCNGDGTQCKLIEEIFNDVGHDYKKVVVLPEGARKVFIDELAPSENTIAISDKTEKKFYLNGNHQEDGDGLKLFGSVEAVYMHNDVGRENLVINGPLKEDLLLYVVFYKKENVGYVYKYAEPTKGAPTHQANYHWELLEWTECTVKCGGGVQSPDFSCVDDNSGKVSPNFCKNKEKPKTEPRKCNEEECGTKWKVGKWGPCQACKDKSGVRLREVECVKEAPHRGADDILVEDQECSETRPGSRELCDSHKTCSKKRNTDNLPDHLMEKVWMQTNWKQDTRRNSFETTLDPLCENLLKDQDSKEKENKEHTTVHYEKVKLTIGKVVKDRIPENEVKLVKIPFKQSHLTLNMSDNAFETMGDSVADTLDSDNAKIITGEKAAKLLNEIDHEKDQKKDHESNHKNKTET